MKENVTNKHWERCLKIIKVNVSADDYKNWFEPIVFDSLDKERNTLVLRVPTHAYCETLEKREFKHMLYNVVWMVYGSKDSSLTITYRITTDSNTKTTMDVVGNAGSVADEKINTRTKKLNIPQQSDLESHLNEEYTFDNFIEGEGNKLLRSVGQSIADNPKQTTFNPLFIYGNSGVGKTHLANAIGIRCKRNFPERRVLYISAHEFKVQYMTARQQNRINDFIYFYQTIDVIIIDDIQELEGLTGTQQAFFHIFNHLKMNGKQIILTSDRPPSSMPGLEDRLITRFKWGLSDELRQPDYALCKKILQSKIRRDGLTIDEDVVDYIAQNVHESVRDLEGILNSMLARSLYLNRDIDISMAKMVVSGVMKQQKKKITIDMIVEKTCNYFGISEDDVMSKSRKANVVEVRQLAMFLAQKYTKLTDSKIGLYIGKRNHATVIHSIRQMQDRMATDKNFAQKVSEVETQLNA